ncbi:MAG: signal peptidase I [Propionibacteriales bacterium]|nr:signal peptidase I [Propionibacteriales bacterium]
MPDADDLRGRVTGYTGGSRSSRAKHDARYDAQHNRSRSKAPTRGKRRLERKQLPLWQELVILLCIALGLAILLKSLFVQLFYIPSASMHDTLIERDRIAVEKVSFWFGEPQRGDIVVFSDPGGWLPVQTADSGNPITGVMEFFGLYPAGDHLVKRVIAVGGDRVRCCDREGRVLVNGEPIDESTYLPNSVKPSLQTFKVRVPENRLWVMGDNRVNSADSRAHLFYDDPETTDVERKKDPVLATIPEDMVVGRVAATVWPLGRAAITDRPETFTRLEAGGG